VQCQNQRRNCLHDDPASMRKRVNARIVGGSWYFGHEHNDVFADKNTKFFSKKRGGGWGEDLKNLGFVFFRSSCSYINSQLVEKKCQICSKPFHTLEFFRLVGSTPVSHSTGSAFESLPPDGPRNRWYKQFSLLPSDTSRNRRDAPTV